MNKHTSYFLIILIQSIIILVVYSVYNYLKPTSVEDENILLVILINILLTYSQLYLLDFLIKN